MKNLLPLFLCSQTFILVIINVIIIYLYLKKSDEDEVILPTPTFSYRVWQSRHRLSPR